MTHIAIATAAHDIRDPRVSIKLAGGLAEYGYRVSLVGGANDRVTDPLCDAPHLPDTLQHYIIACGRSNKIRLKRQKEIWQNLAVLKPDLLIIPDPELIPIALAYRLRHGARIILDLHEDTFDSYYSKNRYLKPLVRQALNRFDGVVIAFELDRRPDHPVPNVPYTEAYNYFPFQIYTPTDGATPGTDPLRICYAGIIARERGCDHLITLVHELRKLGIESRAVLAGRSYQAGYFEAIRHQVAQLGLQDSVELIGGDRFISWFRLQQILDQSDLGFMVFPKTGLHWELPTKIYEFCAHKVPIVSSPIPSFRKFIEQFGVGRVIEASSIEGQAEAIAKYRSQISKSEMGSQFEAVNRTYNWQNELGKIISLIEQIT